MLRVLPLLALALSLVGCAGVNFERPAETELEVGKATYSDVVERFGKPQFTGESTVNDKQVKRIVYSYAASGGEPLESGVIPARANGYFFENDRLIGTEFTSSFKEDHTNFDDSRVQYIKKGETTRSQVLLTFGRPSMIYLPPMVKATNGQAIGYLYSTTRGNVYTGLKFHRKVLLVTFDAEDKVAEIEFSVNNTN